VWSHSDLSTERHNGERPSGHRLTSQKYRARRTSLQELRPEQRHELPTKLLQAGRNILAEALGVRISVPETSPIPDRQVATFPLTHP
jgi:hypothetical protein